MSVLVVGLSHKSAPVAILERAAVNGDSLGKLLRDVAQAEPVAEAFVVSTCNRVEVYADVDRFHAGVTAICDLLVRHCEVPADELTAYLYVHYEDRAVSHLMAVACGLDSVVVGEGQILGQVRSALKFAEDHATMGRVLRELGRLAMRTGKRARAETGIDRAGVSLLTVAIKLAAANASSAGTGSASTGSAGTGSAGTGSGDTGAGFEPLAGRDVLIVGAGSMSALAAATATRSGAASIVVANRTRRHAERLAADVSATAAGLADLPAAMGAADVVVSCTGAAGQVITRDMVSAAVTARTLAGRTGPLVVLDLAMPRDVEPAVGGLPGVVLIGMDLLSDHGTAATDDDVIAVRAIIEDELAAYHSAIDAARVAPTVVALRAKAAKVVDGELARLTGRLSTDGVSGHALDEIAQTVRRVVDKLLHAPTVRVKELAGSPGGEEYAAALRVLFDLDPRAVEAVTRAGPEQEGPR